MNKLEAQSGGSLEPVGSASDDLYGAACVLMRHRHTSDDADWENVQNAAMRYNAARQAARNAVIRNAALMSNAADEP